MSHNPTQRSLLQGLVVQMTLAVGELVTANAAIAAQSIDIAAQTAAIAAMQIDIAAQAADIALSAAESTKTKEFTRFQSEYLMGGNPELADIEAGTHTFPST